MKDRGFIRTRILQELVKSGNEGLTDSELSQLLQANKNHVPTRRRDVELNGLCRKTTSRRDTDNGTPAVVHVATPEGFAWNASGKPVPTRPRSGREDHPSQYHVQHIRGEAVLLEKVVRLVFNRDIIRIPLQGFNVIDGDVLSLQPVA